LKARLNAKILIIQKSRKKVMVISDNQNVMKTRGRKKSKTPSILIMLFFIAADIYLVSLYSYYYASNTDLSFFEILVMMSDMKGPHIILELARNANMLRFFLMSQLVVMPLCYVLYILIFLDRKKDISYQGMEQGSAKWATEKDRRNFRSFDGSIIVQKDLYIDPMDRRLNLNRLIVGGPGSGKSRFEIKPNVMQMNSSYIITDPKGEIYRDTASMLEQNGYKVRVLNLVEPKHSNCYNPFAYIHDEKDVLILCDTIIKNTSDKGAHKGDEFWIQSQRALLQAIIFYLMALRKEYRHMHNVLRIVSSAQVIDEDYEFEADTRDPLSELFEGLRDDIRKDMAAGNEVNNFKNLAVMNYDVFKLAAGKTAKSILVSLAVRLSIWSVGDITKLMATDEMNISMAGYEKTAIFVIIPDSFSTFNVIASMFYSQVFSTLYYEADFKCGGSLPILVQCLLDEFANIGQIPDFEKYIATMRSRNISAVPVIQAMAQLKNLYKETWETILGCCDTLHFLGTTDQETLKYISDKLGKATIKQYERSRSRGARNSRSTSDSERSIQRSLMNPDELFKMPKEDSIVFIKGYPPFYGRKYDIIRHPQYRFINNSPSDIREKLNNENVKYKIIEIGG